MRVVILVAPYVGAWIETTSWQQICKYGLSHPMWVRGLKQQIEAINAKFAGRTLCGCVD